MRRFIQIVEGLEGRYFYHGTSLSSLATIRQDGLTPSAPETHWPEYDPDEYAEGDDDDDELHLSDEAYDPRVFAFEDFESAKQFADNFPEPVILRIPADYSWHDGETSYRFVYTTETVHPSLIEYLANGEWHPLVNR